MSQNDDHPHLNPQSSNVENVSPRKRSRLQEESIRNDEANESVKLRRTICTNCLGALLYHDPDINHQIWNEQTVIERACRNKHPKCLKILIKSGCDVNMNKGILLRTACQVDAIECVKILIENGVDLNAVRENDQRTALMVCCEAGYTDCAKILLENGADSFIKNLAGETCLEMTGSREIQELILSHRFSPHVMK
jgi:ankyrin repeat protein